MGRIVILLLPDDPEQDPIGRLNLLLDGLPNASAWVHFEVEERDLKLPTAQFVARHMEPAAAQLKKLSASLTRPLY